MIRSKSVIGIVVHHSATYPGAEGESKLKERARIYNRLHSTRSWAEKTKADGPYPYIAYHDMMAKNGFILHTVDYKFIKYHASNYEANSRYIGICLDGNYQKEEPTPEMAEQLARYIAARQKEFEVNIFVRGHDEVADSSAPTACPGSKIGSHSSGWLKKVIDRANYIIENGIEEPEPTCEKEKAEIKKLKGDINTLNKNIKALESNSEAQAQEIASLKEDLEDYRKSNEILGEKYKNLEEDKRIIEQDKLKIETELDSLKQSKFFWVLEFLHNLEKKWNDKLGKKK